MGLNCSIPTYEQTVNFVKNKSAGMYQITGEVTQGDISQMLDHTRDHIKLNEARVTTSQGDDNFRYAPYNPTTGTFADVIVSARVTDRTARAFRRNRTPEEVEAIRNHPNNIIKREYGTAAHQILQELGERYYAEKQGQVVDPIDYAKYQVNADYPFTKSDVDSLDKGVREIIDQIWETQMSIDKTGIPLIKFENVLIDPVRDEAGTMDLIAIFSDATAMIFDYKTISPRAMYIKGSGKNRELVSADFVDPSVHEKWKTQLAVYKKILLTHYGVKDVRATRVVPVWTDIAGVWDEEAEEFRLTRELTQVQMGRQQSEFLRNIAAGYEKTVISPIDELIENRYKEATRLNEAAKMLPPDERFAMRMRARDIEMSILDLTEDKDILHLFQSVMAEASRLHNQYNRDPESVSYQQLNRVIESLQALSSFDVASQEMIATMRRQDVALYDNIRDTFRGNAMILETARKMLSTFVEARTTAVLSEVDNRQGKMRRDGSQLLMKEDGFFTQMFLPTSDFSNPLVRRAGYIFEEAYEKSRQRLKAVQAAMEPADEEIQRYAKRTGQTITQVFQSLINPKTGDFHSKLNQKFFKDRAKAVADKNLGFFTKYYRVKEKNRFGETYEEWFERTYNEQRAMLESAYSFMNPLYLSERVDRELSVWVKNNDLAVNRSGYPVSPEAWMRKNGWLEINDVAMEEYISDEWARIRAQPELLLYYNTVTKIIKDLKPILGYSAIKNGSFLPKVRAEFMEKLSQGGMGYLTDSAQGLTEDLRHIFSIREGDATFGMMDYTTGRVDKAIPVLFTNPFKDQDGKVDISQQSHDISRTVRLFAHMAFTYEYMKESEAEILAIKDILKDVKYFEQSETGQKVFNFMHNIATKDKSEGASMTDKVMNNIIDYHLYGVKVQPFQGKPTLTRNLLRAKQYFTLKTLGLGFLPAGASYVAARANAWFEGAKGTAYSEAQWKSAMGNQIRDFKRYNAFGYFFGIHSENEVIDLATSRSKGFISFSNPTYSARVLKYVNERALMRPFSYGDERIDNHVANAMALNYGFDKEGNLRRLVNLPEGTKSVWDMFQVNDQGEVTFEGTANQILQFKRAARATQRGIKGTTNSEDVAYAQTDLILNLMMQFKTWMPGVLNERFGGLKYNELLDAPQWGRYRALLNETEMKASANTAYYILGTTANTLYHLGKNLLLYNRISRLITKGELQLNDELNQKAYQSYLSSGGDKRVTYAAFLEAKRGQIRAMVSELEILLLFSALIFSLGADWDDDGEPLYKDMWLLHKAYQVMNRVKTELTFAYDPFSYATLVNNPIPLASMAKDAARIISNTLDETGDIIFGEDTERLVLPFGANKAADQTEKFHYSIGLIPGGYQLRRLFNLTMMDEQAIK